jgi:hypothetical protein
MHLNDNSLFCVLVNLDIICSPNSLVMTGGNPYDRLYYVKSMMHKIEMGSNKQRFTLSRVWTGSIISGVSE